MKSITHIDLKKMFLEAAKQVKLNRENINAVNVFPVPDADTGSNMSNTLEGIHQAINHPFHSNSELITAILDASLISSQGNSGIIMTAFFIGMLEELKSKASITVEDLAEGFKKGKERAFGSIQDPKPGTILDLISTLAGHFNLHSKEDMDIIFEKSLPLLKKKVFETEEKMAVLKENNVVDAGAVGFYFIIKGFAEGLGINLQSDEKFVNKRTQTRPHKEDIEDHIYEVVAILLNCSVEADLLKEMLNPMGNSLDIISMQEKLKVHIHTDIPQTVKQTLSLLGEFEFLQIVDMRDNSIINL